MFGNVRFREPYGEVMRKYQNGVIKVNGQNTDLLGMDEEVRQRFDAIRVAAAMLGEPQLKGSMYCFDMMPMPGNGIKLHGTVHLDIYNVQVSIKAPAFLWNLDSKKSIFLIIPCTVDFKVQYPVEYIEIEPVNLIEARSMRVSLSRDELVMVLDLLLEGM